MDFKRILATVGLIWWLAGCTAFFPEWGTDTFSFTRDEPLATEFLRTAKKSEEAGDLVAAVEACRMALTIACESPEARESLQRLEKELKKKADQHYRAGLGLRNQGRMQQARKEFLTALRLQPDHGGALDMLLFRKKPRTKGYTVHVVQPGESLGALARLYYGDYRKFDVIASFNGIPDAAKIYVNQKLKIPEILNMESVQDLQAEEGENDTALIDRMESYREAGLRLYKEKRYSDAVVSLSKVIGLCEEDAVSRELLYKAYFQHGKELFAKREYLQAKEQFENAMRYTDECGECAELMVTCEKLYKELHYRRGIEYFGQEQPDKAIQEWMLVSSLDPGYRRVNLYIRSAKEILRKLEEMRREQQRVQ